MFFNQLLSFHGLAHEDPRTSMRTYYSTVENFPLNVLTNEQLRLRCFPYTLKEETLQWFMGLGGGTIASWDQMKEDSLTIYQDYFRSRDLREEIFKMMSKEDETLAKYVEIF